MLPNNRAIVGIICKTEKEKGKQQTYLVLYPGLWLLERVRRWRRWWWGWRRRWCHLRLRTQPLLHLFPSSSLSMVPFAKSKNLGEKGRRRWRMKHRFWKEKLAFQLASLSGFEKLIELIKGSCNSLLFRRIKMSSHVIILYYNTQVLGVLIMVKYVINIKNICSHYWLQ